MEIFKAAFERTRRRIEWMSLFTVDDEWDEYEYQDAVTTLPDLSLIQYRTSQRISGDTAMFHVDTCIETQSKFVQGWTDEKCRSVRDALVVIYKFYADDGRYSKAKIHCCQILDYDKRFRGKSSEAHVESELRVADVYLLRGAYNEAEGIITRLRASIQQYSGQISISLLKNLAKILFKQGRFDETVSLYQDVLAQ
ncbi:hypothetical protein F4782DRAFT_41695 [Xylaria castorea]|nr:hypothetical protein F4782DRAFT_41695 [Xylaria castorea]